MQNADVFIYLFFVKSTIMCYNLAAVKCHISLSQLLYITSSSGYLYSSLCFSPSADRHWVCCTCAWFRDGGGNGKDILKWQYKATQLCFLNILSALYETNILLSHIGYIHLVNLIHIHNSQLISTIFVDFFRKMRWGISGQCPCLVYLWQGFLFLESTELSERRNGP